MTYKRKYLTSKSDIPYDYQINLKSSSLRTSGFCNIMGFTPLYVSRDDDVTGIRSNITNGLFVGDFKTDLF